MLKKKPEVCLCLAPFSGLAKASQFLETQLGEDPVEWKDKQLNKLEKGLNQLLDEWYFDQTYDGTDKKKEFEEKSTCKAKETRQSKEQNGENVT